MLSDVSWTIIYTAYNCLLAKYDHCPPIVPQSSQSSGLSNRQLWTKSSKEKRPHPYLFAATCSLLLRDHGTSSLAAQSAVGLRGKIKYTNCTHRGEVEKRELHLSICWKWVKSYHPLFPLLPSTSSFPHPIPISRPHHRLPTPSLPHAQLDVC